MTDENNYFDINLLLFLSSRGRLLKFTWTDLKPPELKLSLGLALACCLASCRSRTLLLLPLGLIARARSPPASCCPTSPVSVFKQYFTSTVFYKRNAHLSCLGKSSCLLAKRSKLPFPGFCRGEIKLTFLQFVIRS